jgi:hypothetical protein
MGLENTIVVGHLVDDVYDVGESGASGGLDADTKTRTGAAPEPFSAMKRLTRSAAASVSMTAMI